ncbi:MAG: putative trifunctional 2-polyprenylphenol hydroxylase/glutamate synthase subunit beta/ferritin domain-containing protein [bacterium ADurb.Bin270]|nr:MAG: putative trifunctional 2-polyprenylphenol hydroxylase/glutamate synthase subunit beta/ferritin domain-containing protein [bacterium ADurb.Bin270]
MLGVRPFEYRGGLMKNDLTAVEVIGMGIRSEQDAAAFYGKVSKKVKNPLVRAKFEQLAREEVGHKAMLVAMYQKITGEKNPPQIPGEPDTAEKGGVLIDVEDMEELLNFAIFREQESSRFYSEAASFSKDPSGKRTLEYLAGIERAHEAMLAEEKAAFLRDRDWYLNNDDIQLVGP